MAAAPTNRTTPLGDSYIERRGATRSRDLTTGSPIIYQLSYRTRNSSSSLNSFNVILISFNVPSDLNNRLKQYITIDLIIFLLLAHVKYYNMHFELNKDLKPIKEKGQTKVSQRQDVSLDQGT